MGRKSLSKERKKEILEHYYEVIKIEGFEGASIAKIANHMNIHPSMIIHYFKTKDDMLIELANVYLKQFLDDDLKNLAQIKNIKKRFNKFLDIFFGDNEKRNDKKLEMVFSAIIYLSYRNEKIRKHLLNMQNNLSKKLYEELKLYMDSKIIRKCDPAEHVSLLIVLISGFKSLTKHSNKKEQKYQGDLIKSYILELLN